VRTILRLTLSTALAYALIFFAGCDSDGRRDAPKPSLNKDGKESKSDSKDSKDPKDPKDPKDGKDSASAIPTLGAALLDGFEGPEHTVWAFDSADDEGVADYVSEGATQGKKALRVTIRQKGSKGRVHLRREVEMDLSQASALIFDISAPADKLTATLALKTWPGDMYQESKPLNLKSGLNSDVRFPLDGKNWKNEKTKWEFDGPPVNLQFTHRLMLLLSTGEESSGSFLIDNLRVEGAVIHKPADAANMYREWRPEIIAITPPPNATTQFSTFELQVAFRASYRDVFDSNDLACGMRVTTPSGKTQDVRAFFGGLYRYDGNLLEPNENAAPLPLWGPMEGKGKRGGRKGKKEGDAKPAEKKDGDAAKEKSDKEKADAEKPKSDEAKSDEKSGDESESPRKKGTPLPVWLIRYTPLETGRYTMQMYIRNSAGETRTREGSVVVAPEMADPSLPGRKGGNVRVSRTDPRQLELQDGSPFFMYGQNVCWTTDWNPYLEKMKGYGANTCRIWLCPWGINFERKTEPGTYDLKEAERIDRLIAEAEATGVRLIFCFTFHGMTGGEWYQSPYNAANGGPCGRAQEFFTNWKAKAQFKRLLSYAAARWGSSPALLSWELMNEMDLARYDAPEDVSAWAREMAGHLKSVDVHGHLVTTSSTNVNFQPELWNDGRIDFVSVHGYGVDVPGLVNQYLSPYRALNKPVLLAEFGGGTEAGDDIPDKDGARLQSALWLTACSPDCGLALPWWWDTYIESRNLYPVLASAGRFIANEDRRGRYTEWVRKSFGNGVEAWGVMDGQGARLYVHNPGWTKTPSSRGNALLAAATPLELSGVIDGAYRVEFWDAREGKIFSSVELVAKDGRLSVELPAHASEFGIKIDRKEHLRPELK